MSLKKTIKNISKPEDQLQNIRNNIDNIDNKIHDLLIERAEIVEQVVKEKKKINENNLVVYRPSREHEILIRIIQRHKGNLPEKSLINIWRNLISSYISMQAELTLSFSADLYEIVNNHFGGDIKKYSSFLSSKNYNIIADRVIENGQSVIIFSTKASSREEVEGKIKIINNNEFNLQYSPKIMGVYAVFK